MRRSNFDADEESKQKESGESLTSFTDEMIPELVIRTDGQGSEAKAMHKSGGAPGVFLQELSKGDLVYVKDIPLEMNTQTPKPQWIKYENLDLEEDAEEVSLVEKEDEGYKDNNLKNKDHEHRWT